MNDPSSPNLVAGDSALRRPIVRVSFGWFPPEKMAEVAAVLDYTDKPLGAAIADV
jgi:hypothetical protein